jgi:hypothetical protein
MQTGLGRQRLLVPRLDGMRKRSIILGLLLASVGGVPAALAQPSAQPSGPIGIRVGDLEVHPGVSAEVGYDSNPLEGAGRSDVPKVDEQTVPSLRLRLAPSVSVNTAYKSARSGDLLPPRFDLSGRLAGRLDELIAIGGGEFAGKGFPVCGTTTSVKGLCDFDLNLSLDILPKRTWGGNLGLTAVRFAQPANDPKYPSNVFSRTLVGLNAELRWRPGMGNLDWSLGYVPRVTVFDVRSLGQDLLEQSIQIRGRWLFLPRTSLLFQGEQRFVSYLYWPEDCSGTGAARPNACAKTDSRPLTARFGATGLITPKLGVTLMAGWKGLFFVDGARNNAKDFDTPVGRAEVAWYFSGGSQSPSLLRVSYERDADISGLANFYQIDRVQGELNLRAAQVFNINLRGGVAFIKHPARDPAGQVPDQFDNFGELREYRPEARLVLEYHLDETLKVFSNSQFTASPRNNFVRGIREDDALPFSYNNLKFYRFYSMLGVSWTL